MGDDARQVRLRGIAQDISGTLCPFPCTLNREKAQVRCLLCLTHTQLWTQQQCPKRGPPSRPCHSRELKPSEGCRSGVLMCHGRRMMARPGSCSNGLHNSCRAPLRPTQSSEPHSYPLHHLFSQDITAIRLHKLCPGNECQQRPSQNIGWARSGKY